MTIATIFDFILYYIRVDLIIGFGWYSILFFILKLSGYQKDFLIGFDKNACQAVVFLGIVYVTVWLLGSSLNYLFVMDVEGKSMYIERITGPYSFGLWFEPLSYLGLTQLLRIRFVARFLLFRIMICIPFILTFERFVIMYTSYCRDYLPSGWSIGNTFFGISWWEFALSILIKIIEFAIVVFAFKYIKQWLVNFKTKKN